MLQEFFHNEGIFFFREIPAEAVRVWDEKKWERVKEKLGRVESVAVFLIPYYAGQKTTNLSVYAQPRDYHGYIRLLSQRFARFLEERGSKADFAAFADSSPIDERDAALRAGLGFLGENGLLIHPEYGSFVFIGEMFLSRAFSPEPISEIRRCPDCGECRKACPTGAIRDPKRSLCLSLISQKKELTEEESALLDAATCKWGCDLCQNVCPFNRNARETSIPFFREGHVSELTEAAIEAPKEEFLTRAFSWRGRNILRRNMK